MDKKLISNYLYNALFQVLKILIPMIQMPYLLAHVGKIPLGYNNTAQAVLAVFILFGIVGINVYGNREIAKVRDDKATLSKTFFEIFVMQLLDMLLAGVGFVLFIIFTRPAHEEIWWICLLVVVASALDITWFFYGVEDFKSASLRNMAIRIVGVIAIFIWVKTAEDLWKMVFITGMSECLGQAIMFWKLKEYIVFTPVSIKEAYRRHFMGTLLLFIPTIAINIYTVLDRLMLSYLVVDDGDLQLYTSAQNFVKSFLFFITSIGTVVLPRVSNTYHKQGEKGEMQAIDFIKLSFRLVMAIALPMSVAMLVMAPYFFPWFLGKVPQDVPRTVQLVQVSSGLILLISMSNVFGIQYLVPTGRTKMYTRSVIIGALVNLVINFLLIPWWKGMGAALGSLAAEAAVSAVQYSFLRKEIQFDAFDSLWRYALASCGMAAVIVVLGENLSASLMVNLLQASLGIVVYFMILWFSKEMLLRRLWQKFKEEKHG